MEVFKANLPTMNFHNSPYYAMSSCCRTNSSVIDSIAVEPSGATLIEKKQGGKGVSAE